MTEPEKSAAAPLRRPVGAWAIDALFGGLGWLSLRACRRLGCGLGWLMEHVARFRRSLVDSQVAVAFPELDRTARVALRHRIYRHIGQLFVELMRVPTLTTAELEAITHVEGREHVADALRHGRGAFLLTAHLGNWEIGLATASIQKDNIATIVKEIKSPLAQYAIDRIRQAHGVVTFPRHKATFDILRQLRRNGMVGFVLDQNMARGEGVFVDFFGHTASTMPGLATLASRHQTPVLPVQFWRDEATGTYHVRFLPQVPWEDTGNGAEADILRNTARYTHVLEEIIRARPEQWLWLHRRWRTQPRPAAPSAPA